MIGIRRHRQHYGQRGNTLLETLAAVAVAGMLGVGLVALTFEMLNVNARNSNHMSAVKQVEAASRWLYRDAEMAQDVTLQGNNGFPVQLSWTDSNNQTYQAVYDLQDNNLVCSYSVNGQPPTQTVIARDIDTDPLKTNCIYVNHQFTITLTATVDAEGRPASETRVLQIVPRSG